MSSQPGTRSRQTTDRAVTVTFAIWMADVAPIAKTAT